MGPNPPACARAQKSSTKPMMRRNGALTPCSKRMVLIPRRITTTFSSQKNPKQIGRPGWNLPQPGISATHMALMASPPIHA